MEYRVIVRLALFLFGSIVVGCGGGDRDVTNDSGFGDFAPIVGQWKAKAPLRLLRDGSTLHLVLAERHVSVDELALLPPGTELRVKRLVFRETINRDYLNVIGCLTSGPYAGKELELDPLLFPRGMVDQACIYHGYKKVIDMTWAVDADKLERVPGKQPTTAPKSP